jgi:hypothetical protein
MNKSLRFGAAAFATVVFLALMSHALGLRADAERRADGGNRMFMTALLGRVFAMEHGGWYPPVSTSGLLVFMDKASVRDSYTLAGRAWGKLSGPSNAILMGMLNNHPAWDIRPYLDTAPACYYLGYACVSESETFAFLDAYESRLASGEPIDGDLPAPAGRGSFGGDTFFQLREHPEHPGAVAPDLVGVPPGAESRIPVLIEEPGHYARSGGWVVYLDTHAEFLPYPGPFPMSEPVIRRLQQIRGEPR